MDGGESGSTDIIDIKSQNSLLKVCYVAVTSAGPPRRLLLLLFFGAAINSTNEGNKAGSMCNGQQAAKLI